MPHRYGVRTRVKLKWYTLGHKRCAYCCCQLVYQNGQKNSATVEHIIPKSQGGTYNIKNCLMACKLCNNTRGNTDFLFWVSKNNFPRKEWLAKKHVEATEFYTKKGSTS